MGQRVCIEDISRYSPWPARLLGLEPWTPRRMTQEDVLREYDREKWGALLARHRENPGADVDEVDRWDSEGYGSVLCTTPEGLELLPLAEAKQRSVELVREAVRPYLPAPALVELGAGFGPLILRLARKPPFPGMRFFAGEFSPSGAELLERLARVESLPVECGACDLASERITGLPIPAGAVFYTSYALPYIATPDTALVESLLRFSPRAVVHVEPSYEHAGDDLLGLLRKAYFKMNDYNTTWTSMLHQAADRGLIRILSEHPAVYGLHPLLASSVLAWEPR